MKLARMMSFLSVGALLLTVGLGAPLAKCQEAEGQADEDLGKKQIYVFSTDFPPGFLAQYPSPPIQETRFWRLLDREVAKTSDLALTENPDRADYRVELRCTGVFNCSRLMVDVQDSQRVTLGSFTLSRIAYFWGLGTPRLEQVAQQLTHRLDERLKRLEQGDYGHTH